MKNNLTKKSISVSDGNNENCKGFSILLVQNFEHEQSLLLFQGGCFADN